LKDYDKDRIDDAAMAFLFLTMWDESNETRAWKSFDWATTDRLHQKGYPSNPKGRSKSVIFTEK
jgi:hypothetical protein